MKKVLSLLLAFMLMVSSTWAVTIHCFYNVGNHMSCRTFRKVENFRIKDGILYFTSEDGIMYETNTWTIEYN